MLVYLDSLSAIVCAAFLTLGSWTDLRTREVPDKVWAVSLPVASVITAIKIYLSSGLLILYVLSISLSIVVSLVIFEVGFFGGADAKAMISVGVALPLFPEIFRPVLGYFHPFFPLVVLTNSFLLSLLSIAYVVCRNLAWRLQTRHPFFSGFEQEPLSKKFLVLLSGYKVELAQLRKSIHLIPLEDVDESGEAPLRKMRIFVGAEEDRNVVVERLARHSSEGLVQSHVWATPGLPMMVFVSLGFLTALIIGDILFYVVYILVRLAVGV